MRYTYSRWSGDGGDVLPDAEALMEALSDEVLDQGDLGKALQALQATGVEDGRLSGVNELLDLVRNQRKRMLERYGLESLLRDLEEQIRDIVEAEKQTLKERLSSADQAETESIRDSLAEVVRRKSAFLDQIPSESGPAIGALSEYEFMNGLAREDFQSLSERLRQHIAERHFEVMRESLRDLSEKRTRDLRDMVRSMKNVLQDRLEGRDEAFASFKERYGALLPESESADQFIEQMAQQAMVTQALMHGMPDDMRRQLDDVLKSLLQDEDLRQDLAEVAEALQMLSPLSQSAVAYSLSGDRWLALEEAWQVVRRVRDLHALEERLGQAQIEGDLELVDSDCVRKLVGADAATALDRLKQVAHVLEDAGYVSRSGQAVALTARGIRRIGQKTLHDIFRHLDPEGVGRHRTSASGGGGDPADDTKPYEFGDPFLLDLGQTLMNVVRRSGSGPTLEIQPQDFELFRSELLTRASTVLMLDMSRSMPLRGCLVAAKRVAFALNTLIRTQFPRDRLFIVGFSDLARELSPRALHETDWSDSLYGTNMQHGFMVARRLLGKQTHSNKQIILITDGEPTAHFEGEQVHFTYPPTFRTFEQTLREVKRCSQENIVINTFMLDRSHYLTEFVGQMTRINRGRAFFTSPDRLGEYVVLDYVRGRREAALSAQS